MLRLLMSTLGLVVFLSFPQPACAAPTRAYDLFEIPTPVGPSWPTDINNHGDVVGGASLLPGGSRAYVYQGGTLHLIANAWATGINDAGDVVGAAYLGGSARSGFRYNGGALQYLDFCLDCPPPAKFCEIFADHGAITAINAFGVLVGYSRVCLSFSPGFYLAAERGFINDGLFRQDLRDDHDHGTYPYAINDRGQVVGFSRFDCDEDCEEWHAFLYSAGAMHSIDPASPMSIATDINNQTQIVGWRQLTQGGPSYAFMSSGGILRTLFLGEAHGINSHGQITGSGNSVALLYSGGVDYDLNTLITPQSNIRLTRAVKINDRGQIVAEGTRDGISRSFLLTPASQISFHRLNGNALTYSASDEINAPLGVATDPNLLEFQPELGAGTSSEIGLVADGVTPLLIKCFLGPPLPGDVTNNLHLSVEGGTLSGSGLTDHIKVLGAAGWSSDTNVVGAANTIYAYITPINSSEIVLEDTARELTVSVSLNGPQSSLTKRFKIRKPPLVLVHGYNSDGKAWTPFFKQILADQRPLDFVIPINYGVNGTDSLLYFNTYGRLDHLARELDSVLRREIEGLDSVLRKDWAFTRYDVVGHSQGGLLTRLLCSKDATAFFASFRNADNFYRGRFHSIISIGAPHNGSTAIYYAKKVLLSGNFYGWLDKGIFAEWKNLLQTKFDPFGSEIDWANTIVADPGARFHGVRTTIADGLPPGVGPCPLLAAAVGLCHEFSAGVTRGSVVFPRGFDGIVDYESQGGGTGTRVTTIVGENISHSGPYWVFGVGFNDRQTSSFTVAAAVRDLLNGPIDVFGEFTSPDRLSDSVKRNIDLVIPQMLTMNIIQEVFPLAPRVTPPGASSSFDFTLSPPPTEPVRGQVTWSAEIFGTNGISAEGVSVSVAATNSQNVTVSVEDAVQGEVVLYAAYSSTNGTVVLATPVVVLSRPASGSLASIEIRPPEVSLGVNQALVPEFWGIFTNEPPRRLFIPPTDPAQFSSSDPGVVDVDMNGQLIAKRVGKAVITALHRGFSARTVISVFPANGQPVFASPSLLPDASVEVLFTGRPSASYRLEASTDLINWVVISTLTDSSGRGVFRKTFAVESPRRFFRAVQSQ